MKRIRAFAQRCVRNYKIKLFSLLSALFFWVYVSIDNTYDHVAGVPLRLINRPEGFVLLKPIPSDVTVEFKGSGRAFLSYAFRDRRIELDLHRIPRGSTIALRTDMIQGIPPGMDLRPVAIIRPESVVLEFDRFVSKTIPVISDIRVAVADGYTQVGEVQLYPDSVIVDGPQSLIDPIFEVQTKILEFAAYDRAISGKVLLAFEHAESIRCSATSVKYAIEIQRLGERSLEGIPVRLENAPPESRITVMPSTVTLRLQGGTDLLARLMPEDLSVVVDYNDRTRYPNKRIPALIRIPKDIHFSDVQPKFFELVVEK